MKNNFQTLISAILTKVSSTYAKTSEVPIIRHAEVGQTVIVKEVDTNGKPIAWEAGTSSPIPEPTTDDNGKFLRVIDGAASWMAIENAEEATFGG